MRLRSHKRQVHKLSGLIQACQSRSSHIAANFSHYTLNAIQASCRVPNIHTHSLVWAPRRVIDELQYEAK